MSIRLQFLREAWSFLSTFTGRAGEVVVDTTNNRVVVHDGTTPGGFPAARLSDLETLQNVRQLGLGTTADAQNPFAAKLNKALWTALTTPEGGTGDLRYTLNKQAAGNTLSLLFQSAFSGRAELGLTGDDDLRLKVSADGATWREPLRIDRATGQTVLTALSVGGTATASVVASNSYQLAGATILQDIGSGYRGFVIAGVQIMVARDSTADPSTYYSNTTHVFRSRDNLTTFATVSAAGLLANVPVRPASYTVATLPAGTAGAIVYAANARKLGEAAGAGTGVPAYYSNGNWRRLSDDSPVAA